MINTKSYVIIRMSSRSGYVLMSSYKQVNTELTGV